MTRYGVPRVVIYDIWNPRYRTYNNESDLALGINARNEQKNIERLLLSLL